jgi:hypothetical protein
MTSARSTKLGQSLDHFPGLVSTAILDQDDLEAVGELAQGVSQASMQLRQHGRGAIDRDDRRNLHHPGWIS